MEANKPPVVWPVGYAPFYRQLRAAAVMIAQGTVLAIDPGSHSVGYALFKAGVMQTSGSITVPKFVVYERLRWLSRTLTEMFPDQIDCCVIEEIRGAGRFSSYILHWSIGSIIPAVKSRIVLELPLNVWKAQIRKDPTYVKSDQRDSELIGSAAVRLAQEHLASLTAQP